MANTISPNMSLIIPGVGSESGPTYALDINSSLTLLDQHDHSPGKGVQITPAGININSALTLNNNSLTNIGSEVFTAQGTPSTTPQSLSVAPGSESPAQQDLWYTPNTGIPIQITKNGIVNTIASTIPGESYASGTFYWTQAQDGLPTNPANFNIGSITLRPNVASTPYGATIVPPTASNYSLTLFPTLPTTGTNEIVRLDSTGQLTATLGVDNSTIVINSNTLQVPAGGITNTQLAANSVNTTQLVNNSVTQAKLATGLSLLTSTVFTSSGTYTVPAGVSQIYIQAAGGGGGGGGGSAGAGGLIGGGGGGAGALPYSTMAAVTPGQVLTVVVGAGGAFGLSGGNSASGTAGGAGGNSIVYGPTITTTSGTIPMGSSSINGLSPTDIANLSVGMLVVSPAFPANTAIYSIGASQVFVTNLSTTTGSNPSFREQLILGPGANGGSPGTAGNAPGGTGGNYPWGMFTNGGNGGAPTATNAPGNLGSSSPFTTGGFYGFGGAGAAGGSGGGGSGGGGGIGPGGTGGNGAGGTPTSSNGLVGGISAGGGGGGGGVNGGNTSTIGGAGGPGLVIIYTVTT